MKDGARGQQPNCNRVPARGRQEAVRVGELVLISETFQAFYPGTALNGTVRAALRWGGTAGPA
jgi:hypothetical protein